jgi:hypothetical protein
MTLIFTDSFLNTEQTKMNLTVSFDRLVLIFLTRTTQNDTKKTKKFFVVLVVDNFGIVREVSFVFKIDRYLERCRRAGILCLKPICRNG